MKTVTDPQACQDLWRNVLVTVVKDLCAEGVRRAGQREAERWIGNWISRDFREVCELAGVDARRTHAALSALLPLSPRQRRAKVNARRQGIPEVRDAA